MFAVDVGFTLRVVNFTAAIGSAFEPGFLDALGAGSLTSGWLGVGVAACGVNISSEDNSLDLGSDEGATRQSFLVDGRPYFR